MAELLLELLSEEIPARMQAKAAEDLQRLVSDGLAKNGLRFESARAFVTPRRLALVVDGLPTAQPDVSEEKRGPRVGAPEKAVEGFLKSAGLTSLDQCEQRDTGKGVFYFAVINRSGRAAAEVIADVLGEVIVGFPWPKSMRWGDGDLRWVRPLHNILCIFDGRPVPLAIDRKGSQTAFAANEPFEESYTESYQSKFGTLVANNQTRGHRFLAPEPFTVTGFADYAEKLRAAKVLLDQDERRETIITEARRLAAAEGLKLRPDDGLLAEVTGLVEWPVVLLGSIDEAFMDVPAEVLITSMRAHQKYFSLLRGDGSLAPRFVVVANRTTEDGGGAVVAGNQRVLRARLSDAKFFWDTDRRVPLASRVDKLAERLFYAQLGTIADKVRRMQELARHLSFFVPCTDKDLAMRAALLAKADLSSEMVGEFPELQGVMGRYYALNDGEAEAVANAVAEHYAPQGPGDRCPTAPVSVTVALADKLDTLVGFFAIDEKPTGSKDPFALRRAALGVIRLIVENGLRLPLMPLLDFAAAEVHRSIHRMLDGTGETFTASHSRRAGWTEEHFSECWDLLDFFADRLKVHLRESGTRHDLISAVFALGNEDDLVRLLARVKALEGLLASEDGANLLVAYRRAANIVRIEEKKDGVTYSGPISAALLRQPEETALAERLAEVGGELAQALKGEHFPDAMAALARLRQPVDAFFDKVTVNTDESEIRTNRLKLLSHIVAAMQHVADFSRIEG